MWDRFGLGMARRFLPSLTASRARYLKLFQASGLLFDFVLGKTPNTSTGLFIF